MYYETITKDRLELYQDKVRELNWLVEKKFKLINQAKNEGIDYTKTKVINGNSKPTSKPEIYAIKLEKINKDIERIKAFLVPEHEALKEQIGRLKKWYHRRVIVYKFLEGWRTSEIIQFFFSDEEDFEDQKDDKYRKRIDGWISQAVEELSEVSEKPFIKKQQLTIEGLKNG